MAVPKRRTSKARKNNRRAHTKLSQPTLTFDISSGEYRRSHHVSRNGYYKGKKVIGETDNETTE